MPAAFAAGINFSYVSELLSGTESEPSVSLSDHLLVEVFLTLEDGFKSNRTGVFCTNSVSPEPCNVVELRRIDGPVVKLYVINDDIEECDRVSYSTLRVISTEVLRLNDSVEVVTTNGGVRLLSCELEVCGNFSTLCGDGAICMIENGHKSVVVLRGCTVVLLSGLVLRPRKKTVLIFHLTNGHVSIFVGINSACPEYIVTRSEVVNATVLACTLCIDKVSELGESVLSLCITYDVEGVSIVVVCKHELKIPSIGDSVVGVGVTTVGVSDAETVCIVRVLTLCTVGVLVKSGSPNVEILVCPEACKSMCLDVLGVGILKENMLCICIL